MKVISKLRVAGIMLLTLDGDILKVNAKKAIIDGKEYDYDIAFDMKNTIGIKAQEIVSDIVEFK